MSLSIEKDLWKQERLNYYINANDENNYSRESYYFRAMEKIKNGLFEKAISDLKMSINEEDFKDFNTKYIDNKPTSSKSYFFIGMCFQELNQNDSALIYYQKSIESNNYFLDAYLQTASILEEQGYIKETFEFLDNANIVFPNSKKIYFTQALLYLNQNNVKKAKLFLNKAIDIDPSYEDANILLSKIYLNERNIEVSLEIITKSINSSRSPLTALYFRSKIYLVLKDTLKAYFDLNRAFQLDTIDNPVAYPLMMMDFYYQNYERANKIGLEIINKSNLFENISVKNLSYLSSELRYFINYVNDNLASDYEKTVFNSYMSCLAANNKDSINNIIIQLNNRKPSSLFTKRLSIFANWRSNYYFSYLQLFPNVFYFDKGPIFLNKCDSKYQFEETVDAVIDQDSTLLDMYWIRGYFQLLKGEYDNAEITAKKSLELDSTCIDPYAIIALSNFYKDNFQQATSDFQKVIEKSNNFEKYAILLAYSQYKSGDYKSALDTYVEWYENYFLYLPTFTYNLGLCYEQTSMPDSAIKYYSIVSEEEPLNPEYTRGIVRSFLSKKETDRAIEELTKACQREYSDETLLVDLADIYAMEANYNEAISVYKKILHKDKYYAYAYLETANCYMKLKDYAKALENYDDAISCNVQYVDSYIGKAKCLRELENLKESNEVALLITQLNNNQSEGYLIMAENYFFLKQYTISISNGLMALKLDPENFNALYQIAASNLAKGNIEYATQLYKKILETDYDQNSMAFNHAVDILKYMITNNIQSDLAKEILVNYFKINAG